MDKTFILDLSTLSRFVEHSSLDLLEEVLGKLKHNKFLSDSDPFAKRLRIFINKIQEHLFTEHRELFSKIEKNDEMISEIFLRELVSEHQEILNQLEEICTLAEEQNYHDEDFLKELNEMDRILKNHIQLEDELLFPMILNRLQ